MIVGLLVKLLSLMCVFQLTFIDCVLTLGSVVYFLGVLSANHNTVAFYLASCLKAVCWGKEDDDAFCNKISPTIIVDTTRS